MSADVLLTAINVISGVVLIGVGIEMVNNPPDAPWKKWTYRGLFSVFGTAVVVTTLIQAARNEDAQRQSRAELHSDQLANQSKLSYMQGTLDTISKFVSAYVSHPPAQSTKFDPSWALAVLKMAQTNSPPIAAPARTTLQLPGTTQQPVDVKPTIFSVPEAFKEEGLIIGRNFGKERGNVYLHLRVKSSAQRGPYTLEGAVGPDRLFGNLDPSNKLLASDEIQEWTDTSIRMKFTKAKWDDYLSRITEVARGRKFDPPSREDLELGVAVIPAGELRTPSFADFFFPRN